MCLVSLLDLNSFKQKSRHPYKVKQQIQEVKKPSCRPDAILATAYKPMIFWVIFTTLLIANHFHVALQYNMTCHQVHQCLVRYIRIHLLCQYSGLIGPMLPQQQLPKLHDSNPSVPKDHDHCQEPWSIVRN